MCSPCPPPSPTATGAAHWEPLLRARAIENLTYVAAAAQTGHASWRPPDLSATPCWWIPGALSSWMRVARTRVITTTIDTQRLKKLRQQFPVLDHRRFKATD